MKNEETAFEGAAERAAATELRELRALRDAVREGRLQERGSWLRRIGAVAGLVLLTSVATAGAQTVSDSLFVFSAGTPARASEVNWNFNLLQAWIEGKVGPAADPNVTISGSADVAGDMTVTGSETIGGDQTVMGALNVVGDGSVGGALGVSGTLNLDGGFTAPENTLLEQGLTDFCDTSAADVAGCVLDTDGSLTPYARLHVNSFHTTGLGDGQMYIEGASMDGNQTIVIGGGRAGGTDPQGVELGSDLTIGGQLLLGASSYAQNSDSGCMRIDTMQICWGGATADGWMTFEKPFANATYQATGTVLGGAGTSQMIVITNRTTTGMSATCRTHADGACDTGLSWIAIGQAGGSW